MALADTIEQLNNLDLDDINFERIGVWPVVARVAVCVITAIAIFLLAYFLLISDLNAELERVVSKEGGLKRTFEVKSSQAVNLNDYRLQMIEMEESFGALVAQLPSDTEVPGLLEDIDEEGSESGLNIQSIKLQPESKAEFYVELPINIRVQGGYHDLGQFVSGVAGMSRIVTLHNYKISRASGGRLSMEIAAKTYRYKKSR